MLINDVFNTERAAQKAREQFLWRVMEVNGNLSRAAVEKIIDAPNKSYLILNLRQMLLTHHSMSTDVVTAIIDLAGGLESTDGVELIRHIAGLMRWGIPTRRGMDILCLQPPRDEIKSTSQDFYGRSMELYRRCVKQRDNFLFSMR